MHPVYEALRARYVRALEIVNGPENRATKVAEQTYGIRNAVVGAKHILKKFH